MKASTFGLVVLVAFLYCVALGSGATLYSIYYRVIGNANFFVEVASIDAGSPNGTVHMSGGIFNVFASYQNIPSAYNSRLGFLYWAYQDNMGRTVVYEINLKSPSVTSKTPLPGRLYNLAYDSQDNKVYGILGDRTTEKLPVAGNPAFLQMNPANLSNYKSLNTNLPTLQYPFRSDVSPLTNDYYFGNGAALYSLKLSGSGLTLHHLNCSSRLVSIFATKERGMFYGVDANSRIVSVDIRSSTGTCHNLHSLQGTYYTSAYDVVDSEVAVVTQQGLFIYNTHTNKTYEVKSASRYDLEYFTALHFAS